MANPGYPQMGQGPMMPMQGGPMGPPMGHMGMPGMPPMRRGTSRAVPIVVSAGLAVGVFCGLLFGLGTGEPASAEPAKGNNLSAKHADDTAQAPAPATAGATTPTAAGTPSTASTGGSPTKNPNAIATGAKPATAPAAGSTAPTIKTIKLTIKVEPDGAASGAKIVVDGKEITGTTVDLPVDHKQVKLAVTANGFHSYDKKLDVVSDGDMSVTVEMVKRGGGAAQPSSPGFGGASTGGNHVPTAPPKPKKPSNNGIIDI